MVDAYDDEPPGPHDHDLEHHSEEVPSRPPVRIDGEYPPASAVQQRESRYKVRAVLGEGGMAELFVCRDRRIGRDVALKAIPAEAAQSAEVVARFEREARVQGQLEHPSVVPVYDLGVDAEGRSFFTMKRLRGRTLAEVLGGLRTGNAALVAEYSVRRLLTAFSQVCMAVAFAHSRGVLHRDIKPENIMFGDFGEVYLLDWGIAIVVADLDATADSARQAVVDADIDDLHKTRAGQMVGTLGFMSPEQVRGNPAEIDERADVFALGSVLFELLTLERLIPGATATDIASNTLRGVDACASLRTPEREIAPELDRICIRATAPLADRYASARALHEDLERYLNGDRDLARRRELAAERVVQAEKLAARSSSEAEAEAQRTEALRELAAAVALDPENKRAQQLLGRMLLEGPKKIPAEARHALDDDRRARRSSMQRTVAWLSPLFLVAPLCLFLLGVQDWRYFFCVLAVNVVVPLAAFYTWRRGDDRSRGIILLSLGLLTTSFGFVVLGPLVHVPSNVLAIAVVFVALSTSRKRLVALPLAVLAILVPLALQLTGVIAPSYAFDDGSMKILPLASSLPQGGTLLYLAVVSVLALCVTLLVVHRQRKQLDGLEERLFFHAWSLQRLVPKGADIRLPMGANAPPSRRPSS